MRKERAPIFPTFYYFLHSENPDSGGHYCWQQEYFQKTYFYKLRNGQHSLWNRYLLWTYFFWRQPHTNRPTKMLHIQIVFGFLSYWRSTHGRRGIRTPRSHPANHAGRFPWGCWAQSSTKDRESNYWPGLMGAFLSWALVSEELFLKAEWNRLIITLIMIILKHRNVLLHRFLCKCEK